MFSFNLKRTGVSAERDRESRGRARHCRRAADGASPDVDRRGDGRPLAAGVRRAVLRASPAASREGRFGPRHFCASRNAGAALQTRRITSEDSRRGLSFLTLMLSGLGQAMKR